MIKKAVLIAAALVLVVMLVGPDPVRAGHILKTGKKLYSQCQEELVVRDFFNDRRGGIFVDIGCSDYKEFSTTYYLEHHLGWTGIGADALDEYEADYKKYRPATKFCNYIVTDHTGGTTKIFVNVEQKSLSSIVYEPRKRASGGSVELPDITLNDLLKRYGIKHFNFLSVDVEGSEPLVLAGFDIRRFKPELVCIEANKEAKIQKAITDYFAANGYENIEAYSKLDVGQNWYFRPKPAPLLEAIRSLRNAFTDAWRKKTQDPDAGDRR